MSRYGILKVALLMLVLIGLISGNTQANALSNLEPISAAGPDQSVNTLALGTLDASASNDPDGHLPLSYQWTQINGTTVVLSDATSVSPIFTAPDDPDTLTFSLIVTDNLGLPDTTPDEVVITINNQPPVANAGLDQELFTSSLVILNGAASIDPDSDLPLTYLWTQISGKAVALSDPTASSPTFFAPADAGVFTFSLTVTDSLGMPDPTPDMVTIMTSYATPPMVYLPIIIKQIPPPAAFNKTSPINGAINQLVTPTLSWNSTSPVTLYEFCYDVTNDNACSNWISNGTSNTITLPTLMGNTTYYWQVRAWNGSVGPTYSNGATTAFWSFKTQIQPWTNIFTERFEGIFPGSWELYSELYIEDGWYDVTDYLSWGQNSCRKAAGSYCARAVGGGIDGSSVPCDAGYPDDYYTEMINGPFNLSQVKDGLLSVKAWYDTQLYADEWFWGVSVDGDNFYGTAYSGYSNWVTRTIDLKNVYFLGNVTGHSQVWLMITFESDSSYIGHEDGVWIDDLVLSACYSTNGCSGTPGTLAVDTTTIDPKTGASYETLRQRSGKLTSLSPVQLIIPWSVPSDIQADFD